MIFSPMLAAKVLDGAKTVTRRRYTLRTKVGRYRAGRVYSVQPGRGKRHVGHILVTDVRDEPLVAMRDYDARREGFADLRAFRDYWAMLHGGECRLDEVVAVIEFSASPPCADCALLVLPAEAQQRAACPHCGSTSTFCYPESADGVAAAMPRGECEALLAKKEAQR